MTQHYPEPSNATAVLILGILGLFVSVLSPIAWYLGSQEINAIDSGRRSPENRSLAYAGRVLGIVGTVMLVLGLLFLGFVTVLLISAD